MHYLALPSWMEPENYGTYKVCYTVLVQLFIFTNFQRIVWNAKINLNFIAIYPQYYSP